MPATAAELGVDPHDWKQNVTGWADYMRNLQKRFAGNYPQMLAAYNWGMGNLRRVLIEHGAEWQSFLPAETKQYLEKILAYGNQQEN